jgi:fatty aldehyde decarbonylase
MVLNTSSLQTPQFKSSIYRDAYSRINGMVVVGEGLADRHFRLLARAIPEDQQELERLAAMEGRHASDFVGCGRNLGVKPDVGLARQLFAPLHALFLERDRLGDLAGCLVIQGLVVECFAVAAYRHYLPVADAYAAPITAAVIADEGEHLGYAERWLQERFAAVDVSVAAISRRALPITLSILQSLAADLQAIGMDPIELLASFSELFQQALETIGFEPPAARRILAGAAAAMV